MLSFNTLTPHYEEDVVYALNSHAVAKHFGLDQTAARVSALARTCSVCVCLGGGGEVGAADDNEPASKRTSSVVQHLHRALALAHPHARTHARTRTHTLSTQGLGDLLRENEDGVSVMQFLRSTYPRDWDNLLERLKPELGGLDPK